MVLRQPVGLRSSPRDNLGRERDYFSGAFLPPSGELNIINKLEKKFTSTNGKEEALSAQVRKRPLLFYGLGYRDEAFYGLLTVTGC